MLSYKLYVCVDIEASVWVLVITKPGAVTESEQGLAVLHHKLF